jgi:hypothetical protein
MSKKREKNPDPDDDLRWFNEVYVPRFSSETAMIADLDQQLAATKRSILRTPCGLTRNDPGCD